MDLLTRNENIGILTLIHGSLYIFKIFLWKCKYMSFFLAPTAGPKHVQVSNTNSTSLRVTWDLPLLNETHGIIREYHMRYRKVQCTYNGSSSTAWVPEIVNGSTISLDITGLMKWSCYEVQIRAVTIKNGLWSGIVQQRTSEDGKLKDSLSTYSAI